MCLQIWIDMLLYWWTSCPQFLWQRILERIWMLQCVLMTTKSISSSWLSNLCQINRLKHLLDTNTLLNVINALVFSKLYYCSFIWSSRRNKNINKLQHVQTFAVRIITLLCKFDHIIPVLRELRWLPVSSMLIYRDGILAFKCFRGLTPDYLAKKVKTRSDIHNRDTRNKNKIDIPGYRTALGQRTFHYRAVSLWNALPKRCTSLCVI